MQIYNDNENQNWQEWLARRKSWDWKTSQEFRKPQTLLSDRFTSLSSLSHQLSSWQNMVGGFLLESHNDCHCHVSKCWDFQREAGRGWSDPSHLPPQTLSSVNSRHSHPKVVSKLSQNCIKVVPNAKIGISRSRAIVVASIASTAGTENQLNQLKSKVGPTYRYVGVGDDGIVISMWVKVVICSISQTSVVAPTPGRENQPSERLDLYIASQLT